MGGRAQTPAGGLCRRGGRALTGGCNHPWGKCGPVGPAQGDLGARGRHLSSLLSPRSPPAPGCPPGPARGLACAGPGDLRKTRLDPAWGVGPQSSGEVTGGPAVRVPYSQCWDREGQGPKSTWGRAWRRGKGSGRRGGVGDLVWAASTSQPFSTLQAGGQHRATGSP